MERFVRYSLEKQRPIRAVFLAEDGLKQKKVQVLGMEDGDVTLRVGAGKKPVVIPLEDILSCDYARGDHGED